MSPLNKRVAQYVQLLRDKGLKSTRQRQVIVEEFCRSQGHMTADELWKKARKRDGRIGYATVYRTIKHLAESGLINKSDFGGGHSSFERIGEGHHDHLICLDCGNIVEFVQERIEALQEEVTRKYGYQLVRHKMELYGYCPKCRRSHSF